MEKINELNNKNEKDVNKCDEYTSLVRKKLDDVLNKAQFANSLIQNKEWVFFDFLHINSREHLIWFLDDFFEKWYFFVNTENEKIDDILLNTFKYIEKKEKIKIWECVNMLTDDKKNKAANFRFNISWNEKTWFDSASCEFRQVFLYSSDPVTKQPIKTEIKYSFDEFLSLCRKNKIKYWLDKTRITETLENWKDQTLIMIAKTLQKIDWTDAKIEQVTNLSKSTVPKKLSNWRVDNKNLECIFVQVNAWTKLIKKIPVKYWKVWIDIKWNLLIPEEVKDFDLENLVWIWVEAKIFGLGEFLISTQNWYVQNIDWKYSVEDTITSKEIIWVATGNLEININNLYQYWDILKDYELRCYNIEYSQWTIGWSLISRKWNIYIKSWTSIIWWKIRALDWDITCDWEIYNWTSFEALKWNILIHSQAEFGIIIAKNINIKKAVWCTIIWENIEIDEIIWCNVIWKSVKIWKIIKPKQENSSWELWLNKITIWVKNFEYENQQIESKKKMLETLKIRHEFNKTRIKEITSILEISTYIHNKKSIDNNPWLEISEELKKDLAKTLQEYWEKIDQYYQLEKMVKSNEELISRLEKEIDLLNEYIKRFLTSEEKILLIWFVEDNSLLNLRFWNIFDKIDFEKITNIEDWYFFDLCKLTIDLVHKNLFRYFKVDEQWKEVSLSNSQLDFKEIVEYLKLVDIDSACIDTEKQEKINNSVKDYLKKSTHAPAEYRESRRLNPRIELHKLCEYIDVDEIFKEIEVNLKISESNYLWTISDISLKWVWIRIKKNNSKYENNSTLNQENFWYDKKINIDFQYTEWKNINKFNLEIKVKNIYIDEEKWIIRVWWEFCNISNLDDSNINKFINQITIAVIRNMKNDTIPRSLNYLSK